MTPAKNKIVRICAKTDNILLGLELGRYKVCQFMHALTDVHWSHVKRILRYLKHTVNYGLLITRSSSLYLITYTDSDWAGCPNDRKSTGGFAIYVGNNLIS